MRRFVPPPARRLALVLSLTASVNVIVSVIAPLPIAAQIGTCEPARTALVLAGGGSKGLVHIGLLQALDSLGIRPDLIVGTSMGAILGAMYAAGESGREIETRVRAANLDVIVRDYAPRVSASLGVLKPLVVWERESSQWVLQTGAVRESEVSATLSRLVLSANLVAHGDFDALPIPFRAVATDLDDRSVVALRRGDLARALRASMALPLLMRPMVIDGRTLVDGGLSSNVPVGVARALGAERIIVSTIASPKPEASAFDDPLTVTSAVFEYLWVQDSLKLQAHDVLIAQPTAAFGMLDFADAVIDSLIDLGRRSADASLAGASCIRPIARGPIVAALPRSIGIVRMAAPDVRDRSAVLRSLGLETGTPLDPARVSDGIARFTANERYRGLWLNPSGDSARADFDVLLDAAPSRAIGLGVAFDHTMSGRLWLGGVNRNLLAGHLEGTALFTAGTYRADLAVAARRRARIGRRDLPVGGSLEVATENVRLFQGESELPSVHTDEMNIVLGIRPLFERGWTYELGADYRVWRQPQTPWHGTVGARYAVRFRGTDLREPSVEFQAITLSDWQRVHLHLAHSQFIGAVEVRPRVRAGWGRRLPLQQTFMLGGLDGFAGLRMTEQRGDHELFGSLLVRWPLWRRLLGRVEPMVGVTGTGDFFSGAGELDGTLLFGGRVGVEFETPIGPIRVEQGFNNVNRRQALIRVGHWF